VFNAAPPPTEEPAVDADLVRDRFFSSEGRIRSDSP
jgi:hypothetical protein